MSEQDQPKGFKVTDRRAFAADATAKRDEEKPAAVTAAPTEPGHAASAPDAPAVQQTHGSVARGLPPVDFHTFMISLGSSALLHLGEIEDPEAGGAHVDLVMAKHTIDVIAMIEQKTRGNLTPDESGFLTSLLYDLRLRYVEAARKSPS